MNQIWFRPGFLGQFANGFLPHVSLSERFRDEQAIRDDNIALLNAGVKSLLDGSHEELLPGFTQVDMLSLQSMLETLAEMERRTKSFSRKPLAQSSSWKGLKTKFKTKNQTQCSQGVTTIVCFLLFF